jgi:hypothetical protein
LFAAYQAVSSGQFVFQLKNFLFSGFLNLIQECVMIVDFVEQFVDETDEFLRLAVQNVVGGGVQDQIL